MGVYGVIDSSHCNVVKKSGTQRSLECKVGQTNDEVVTAVYQYYLNDDETKSKPILLYWDYKIGYDNRQFWEQITFDRAQYENDKEARVKNKVCSNRLEYQQSIVERIKELPKGPTAAPSDAPSGTPSAQLSRTPEPTQFPTFSAAPSVVPTSTPTVAPSDAPSGTPSTPEPTQFPTFSPSSAFPKSSSPTTNECSNAVDPFPLPDGSEGRCSFVANIGQRRKAMCTETYKEKCPGLCGFLDNKCGCQDYELEFIPRLGSNKIVHCDTISVNKCHNKRVKKNCPSVCVESCA